MLFRLVHHPDGGDLRTDFSRNLFSESGFTVKQMTVSSLSDTVEEDVVEPITLSIEEIERLINSSKTESSLSKIPAKLAVTELIKGSYDDEEGRRLFENPPSVKQPRFLAREALDPAQRGTAMHKYCRYANLSEETESEIQRLVDGGYLSEEEGTSLNRYRIDRFRNGFVANLITSADEVRKEDEFVVRLPASLYNKNADDSATMLVQGAMDLLVRKGDRLILVDYKTDKADEPQLLDRYLKQLDIYRLAAQKAYGLPVTEVYIWSFYLSKEIDCTPYLLSK
jgi:ATP-dependent helicase/nuclease subunit A